MPDTEQINIKIDPELKRRFKHAVPSMSEAIKEYILDIVGDSDDVSNLEKEIELEEAKVRELKKRREKKLEERKIKEEEYGPYQERLQQAEEKCMPMFKRVGWVSTELMRKTSQELDVKNEDLRIKLNKHPNMEIKRPDTRPTDIYKP